VEVRTGVAVTGVTRTAVRVGDERLAARTVLWAAGVAASPLGRDLGVPTDRQGRAAVAADLGVPGPDGRPLPGLCQVAMQAGKAAANNAARALRGAPTRPFRYHDFGTMATIGRGAAVADIGGVRFSGPLAWLAWLTIHIAYLIGFDNRLLVLTQWAWALLTDERGARLITAAPTASAGRTAARSRRPATERRVRRSAWKQVIVGKGGKTMARGVREGYLGGGLPHLWFGDGPPLVVFPGLGMTNAMPTGIQRWGELRLLAPLGRAATVHWLGRRVGLGRGATMAGLARDYAGALAGAFGAPVDVLGISTGGSLALQLAADRPALVRRLVVAGAACRLSDFGRAFQRETARRAAAGDRRGLARLQAADVADSRLGRAVAGWALGLAGPLFIRRGWDPADMLATIAAEDAFDLRDRLREISAPTLIVGGGRDRFYPADLFRETAAGLPDARLLLYEDRTHGGTFIDRRFARDIAAFLAAGRISP
jgi:pimeloyl-ACP methyl ester carboxylesterase